MIGACGPYKLDGSTIAKHALRIKSGSKSVQQRLYRFDKKV
jgi:hypothetical protein